MKPNDLYAREPESVTKELWDLDSYYSNFMPEFQYQIHEIDQAKNERITIKVYKDFCFDGERGWRLCSVWLDEKPFMILRNAGRGYSDHNSRFVTDKEVYLEFISYLTSLVQLEYIRRVSDLADPDEDIEGLDHFYGYNLNSNFERWKY